MEGVIKRVGYPTLFICWYSEFKEFRDIREFKEFRELRERLSLNSLNSLNSLIYHLNQRTNFSSEVPRFTNKSKLPWKEVYSVYISFQGNELGGRRLVLITRNKFVVRRVPSATLGKNGDDG